MTGRIAIVGGGYIGSDLAQSLDSVAEVTLIEPRECFVHAPAMIRGVVSPDILDQAILPYDHLLSRGKVVRDRATEITGDGVVLQTGGAVEADYIVVATGSRYAAPFKPAGDDIAAFRAASAAARAALDRAGRVAIIGAGAVGVELAGEIKSARPGTGVVLISETQNLLPDYPARLGAELRRKLALLGVEVIAGHRATSLADTEAPFPGPIALDDGREIAVDLVFPATGARPVTDLLRTLPDAKLGKDGRVLTDNWMRPSSLPNVFAAGDAAANGDAMTIVAATRQGPWLARTLKALLAGRKLERLTSYKPWHNPPLLVPLGPQLGNSVLPIGVVGNTPTRMIKGKALFIPKYRKQFGLS